MQRFQSILIEPVKLALFCSRSFPYYIKLSILESSKQAYELLNLWKTSLS